MLVASSLDAPRVPLRAVVCVVRVGRVAWSLHVVAVVVDVELPRDHQECAAAADDLHTTPANASYTARHFVKSGLLMSSYC